MKTTFQMNGGPVPPTPEGHYEGNHPFVKVLFSDELLAAMKLRDDECNGLIVDIGEPGPDGFYTPTITRDETDNPLKRLEVCGTCKHLDAGEEDYEGWHIDCAEAERVIRETPMDERRAMAERRDPAWTRGMGLHPSGACIFAPSRWAPYWEADHERH